MFSKRKAKEGHALLSRGKQVGEQTNLETSYDGLMFTVVLDGVKVMECTSFDAMYIYLATRHFLGKDVCERLDAVKPDTPWKAKE